eukprot:TRINITY_DN25723_c0_g1_i1.p1 TRINITY_DN25723_c0_g1~~TRINITY_DN25723_c0_g1_i1.p1  ORF type:complete len:550 (+),score=31.63 TRINITY_DN25723_c0_g1_i1:23-1672(+)
MSKTITFGELEFQFSRSLPLVGGVAENYPVDYPTEVRYKNINPQVNVTRTNDPPRTARPVQGAIVEGVPVQVVAQSEGATLQAVKKRCDYLPQKDVSALFLKGHDELMAKLHERDEIRLDREAIQAYLDEMSGQKRERLAALLDSQDFTLPGYTDKVVFAKSEALLKHEGGQPRIVYQGGDMYNLVMGSVVYYLSRRIAEELNRRNPKNKGNQVLYCVGMTADEIADLVHHTPGEAFENDFKNNDGTQPAGVRKWESMFYYKLGAPKWFVREFAANTSVRVFTRYGLKGKVTGQRWSGEVTTTTGNGYVNACVSLAAVQQAGITESTIFVYGDDNMTYTTQSRADVSKGFSEVSGSIGMTSEVKLVEKREETTFLRKRFVPSVNRTFPVPSFGRVVAKLPIRANFNKAVSDEDYMAGKLLSAAYEHRHIFTLRTLLLETAEQMSATPYLDMRNQAMAYKYTAEELKTMTVEATTIDADRFGSFLHSVYGIWEEDLVQCYTSVCDGILGFRRVNTRRGKHQDNTTMLAPKIPRALWDTAFESIVTVDVSL